jgi:hypothetical protein
MRVRYRFTDGESAAIQNLLREFRTAGGDPEDFMNFGAPTRQDIHDAIVAIVRGPPMRLDAVFLAKSRICQKDSGIILQLH